MEFTGVSTILATPIDKKRMLSLYLHVLKLWLDLNGLRVISKQGLTFAISEFFKFALIEVINDHGIILTSCLLDDCILLLKSLFFLAFFIAISSDIAESHALFILCSLLNLATVVLLRANQLSDVWHSFLALSIDIVLEVLTRVIDVQSWEVLLTLIDSVWLVSKAIGGPCVVISLFLGENYI